MARSALAGRSVGKGAHLSKRARDALAMLGGEATANDVAYYTGMSIKDAVYRLRELGCVPSSRGRGGPRGERATWRLP